MKRLGILYPPTGAESEYYVYGESLDPRVRITLIGVRTYGEDEEHDPRHMRRTARIENIMLSAGMLQPLRPDSVMWACTSGSFIDGVEHARNQVAALRDLLGCPASSTSLAFVAALRHLGIEHARVLGSYPEQTSKAFASFMQDAGVHIETLRWLDAPSGPDAARFGDEKIERAALELGAPADGALLVPDTAMPTMHLVESLERELGRVVLTANQVSLWEAARLAGIDAVRPGLGRLFA